MPLLEGKAKIFHRRDNPGRIVNTSVQGALSEEQTDKPLLVKGAENFNYPLELLWMLLDALLGTGSWLVQPFFPLLF